MYERNRTRILLYVFFDQDGILDDYVVYQLEQMRTQVDKIVMICQGGMNEGYKPKAESLAEQVIYRANKGYDAGAWKDAILNRVGWDEIGKYDDLILMNDSCFGPIYPIEEMFEEMDARDCDFWGVTEGGEGKDPYGYTKTGRFPRHIQSYFTCYKKEVHSSKSFSEFWNNLEDTDDFEKSVTFFEVSITDYLNKDGFEWDTFTKVKAIDNELCKNPTQDEMDNLLINQRNPFIKKKSMMDYYVWLLKTSDANLTRRSMDYITTKTDYDENLIYKTIIRLCHVRELYELYHWDYILPETAIVNNHKPCKVALIMHLYYEDQFEYCCRYAKSMTEYSDIYITVADEVKKKKIEALFNNIKCNKLEVRLIKNKGMDLAGLLIGGRDLFHSDYDYICFIHDKKSYSDTNPRSGEAFRDNMFECMLSSREYVENIIGLLDSNQNIGILAPPYPYVGLYTKTFGRSWSGNFEGVEALVEKLGIRCKLDKKKDPIALGTAFWCRPQALKKLMDYPWSYDDFDEPSERREGDILHNLERIFEYVAQDQGMYTATTMPTYHAQIYFSNANYELRKNLKENRKLKKKVNSNSYKIGHTITAVPRRIKKAIK